jgi:transposase
MLEAIVAGNTDASAMAELAQGRMRKKIPQLQQALVGRVEAHQRFLIRRHLQQIEALDAAINHLSVEIAERVRPCEAIITRLDTIPGIGRYVAEALIAEIGTDMCRFATAAHLASWAGMCPGNNESAGKRLSGKTRKGSSWLRALLVQAAHAAARTRDTYLADQYGRLVGRRGKNRAAVAVGHTILVIAYHIIKEETEYHELGPHYFDEHARAGVERRLVRRLEQLGYTVTPAPTAVAQLGNCS